MAEFELATESNALLEDDRDAEAYARNAKRLKRAKRQRFALISASIVGFIIVIILLRYTSFRHHVPPGERSPTILSSKKTPLLTWTSPVTKDPPVDSPITQLEPEFFDEYGSKRVQIKYGPFTVPGSGVNNGMKNFKLPEAKLPCHGCLITWMQAGLEFADGSYANANTGMWLHHTVLVNRGRSDVKSCRPSPQRFFASGNERTVLDLTLNGSV